MHGCFYLTFLTLFSCFIISSTNCFGQKEVVSQWNGWYMYFGNHRLTEQWGLHTEYQWRRSEIIKKWQQSLARVGVDYRVNNQIMVSGGYGYIISFPYGEQPIAHKFDEHRIWQQLILNHSSGRVYFNHRYRLEQRWLENVIDDGNGETTTDGYRYANRVRYRFMVNVPLNNSTMQPNTLFISVYDEVFLGFGKNIALNILDQNRLYGALGYQFSNAGNVQFGYLFHKVIKGDGVRMENNHTLQLALFYNMDFRKTSN